MTDAARELKDLRLPPGNHLEALSGNRAGQHSLRIDQLWRICIWLSILVRKPLPHGNSISKEHLKQGIEAFVAYFNAIMAKPFCWTMQDTPLTA